MFGSQSASVTMEWISFVLVHYRHMLLSSIFEFWVIKLLEWTSRWLFITYLNNDFKKSIINATDWFIHNHMRNINWEWKSMLANLIKCQWNISCKSTQRVLKNWTKTNGSHYRNSEIQRLPKTHANALALASRQNEARERVNL